MKYLLLWLEGPLQSWGTDSKFDFRKTMPFPSQSGVFGMLLAASGDSGPQEELLAQMTEAPFSVITFKNKTRMLLDFHMVGNGYDEKDPWETLHIPRKSDGTKAVGGGAKRTYREFLQNRTFAVTLGLQEKLAEKFANALQAPVYDLYLGRKCCPPTSMIFHGYFDSEQNADDALKKILNAEPEQQRHIPEMIYQTDPQHSDPAAILVNDVPVRFGKHKLYRDRWVSQRAYDL